MKTGVVGFGVAAQFMHLPFIITNPKFQLQTILQRKGDEAKEKYPDGWKAPKPYLRIVPQPDLVEQPA